VQERPRAPSARVKPNMGDIARNSYRSPRRKLVLGDLGQSKIAVRAKKCGEIEPRCLCGAMFFAEIWIWIRLEGKHLRKQVYILSDQFCFERSDGYGSGLNWFWALLMVANAGLCRVNLYGPRARVEADFLHLSK
jgi:hypothetical protein